MPRRKQITAQRSPRPAHDTKHEPELAYPFLSCTFRLRQFNDGRGNGTGLWLGSQCLSLYLEDIQPTLLKQVKSRRKLASESEGEGPKPRAIELGSGIGLGALALASSGWDVVATDVALIVDAVLLPNAEANATVGGSIQVRELDWSVSPTDWDWNCNGPIATQTTKLMGQAPSPGQICPPFDLIITSDTIFSREFVTPLLRTLHHLASQSKLSPGSETAYYPPAYVAIENRDPMLVSDALKEAREAWNFDVTQIPNVKIEAALKRGGVNWSNEDWDGLEIWLLRLRSTSSSPVA